MWLRYKPKISKLVMWTVKNHWILLVTLVGIQYFTGKVLAGNFIWLNLDPQLVYKVHSFLGFLILISAIALTLDKLFLWLVKKGRI